MVQNLAWAVGYNVLAIPLAAGALAWAGVVLPPAVGSPRDERLDDRRRGECDDAPAARPSTCQHENWLSRPRASGRSDSPRRTSIDRVP